MMMSTDNGDTENNDGYGLEGATDDLLRRWVKDAPEKPSEPETETEEDEQSPTYEGSDAEIAEATSDSDESPEEETAEEETEETAKDKKYLDTDDVYVKVKVDGKEQEFAVSDLKRLAGQEASLTRKSQEVATRRKQVDEAATAHGAALQALHQRALERWDPYSKVDFLVAAQQLQPEELKALRAEATRAWEEVKFFEQEFGQFSQQVQQRQHTELVKQAQEAQKVLEDPTAGIPGWSEQMYDDIRGFAIKSGIDQQVVDRLVDPAAFKILHMAMLYSKGKEKVVKTVKTKTAPKKVIKSTSNSANTKKVIKPGKVEEATKLLKTKGSTDAAADLFLARWEAAASDE